MRNAHSKCVRSAGMALPAALAETGSRPQADSPQLSAYGLVRGLACERNGRQPGAVPEQTTVCDWPSAASGLRHSPSCSRRAAGTLDKVPSIKGFTQAPPEL